MAGGFVKGLTGREPSEITEEIGETIRESLEELREEGTDDEESIERQKMNSIVCGMLTDVSVGFLEMSTSELLEAGVEINEVPFAFAAKNDFYHACEINPLVRGIGFSEEHDFPIDREVFQKRIAPVVREDDQIWEFSTERFSVTSPNWDQHDRKRLWKGRDRSGSIAYFHIQDQLFWQKFENDELTSNNIEILVGQIAFQRIDGRRRNIVVLNVLEFNEEQVSPEVSQTELVSRLENLVDRDLSSRQQDFFVLEQKDNEPNQVENTDIDEDYEPPLLE